MGEAQECIHKEAGICGKILNRNREIRLRSAIILERTVRITRTRACGRILPGTATGRAANQRLGQERALSLRHL